MPAWTDLPGFQAATYKGPSAADLTAAAPPTRGGPADMQYWLGQKYFNISKQTEGMYQKDISEASKTAAEGKQVAPSAASTRALQGAQTGLIGEQAETERYGRQFGAPGASQVLDVLRQLGVRPPQILGAGAPASALLSSSPRTSPQAPWLQMPSVPPATPNVRSSAVDPLLDTNRPLVQRPRSDLLSGNMMAPWYTNLTPGFRKGTSNVQSKGGKGGGGGKAAKGGGGKAAKGGGGGAGAGAGAPPAGLEQILPALMAASQGGGAAGPQAADAMPPAMAPGSAAPPGFAEGTSNVVRSAIGALADFYHKGLSANPTVQGVLNQVPGSSTVQRILQSQAANDAFSAANTAIMPKGFAAGEPDIPSQLPLMSTQSSNIEDRRGQTYQPPGALAQIGQNLRSNFNYQLQDLWANTLGRFPAAPGSTAEQAGYNDIGRTRAPAGAAGLRRGTPSVQPNPGYPFGAGYLFGATAVPGQGSGRVDKVPAMLAPHEAVLNRAAADILGRGKIAALNAQGVRQMGMQRGVT